MPFKGYLIGIDYINYHSNIYIEEGLMRHRSFGKKMLYNNVKEGQRQRRANENPEQAQIRRQNNARIQNIRRDNENAEQAQIR